MSEKMDAHILLLFIYFILTVETQTRFRRNIFQTNDRMRISSNLVTRFPFASIVKLNNGCTGTLIWYKHVLTSAHCLSDGKSLLSPVDSLLVGLLNGDGSFNWMKVRKVFLPNAWRTNRYKKFIEKDYAVIELRDPHNRKWLPLGTANQNKNMQFAGFPSDKPANELWFSHCPISKQFKHILLNRCYASKGLSGSGIYTYQPYAARQRTVIAVFSSKVRYLKRCSNDTQNYVNVATKITLRKMRKICKWIKAGKNCYSTKPILVV